MRKFGIQKFLNSVDSPDSGWVKFSVIKSRKTLGRVTTRTIIADCSQQIELEYDLYLVTDFIQLISPPTNLRMVRSESSNSQDR